MPARLPVPPDTPAARTNPVRYAVEALPLSQMVLARTLGRLRTQQRAPTAPVCARREDTLKPTARRRCVHTGRTTHAAAADAGELALAAEVARLRQELNQASCEKKALEAAFAAYKAGERAPEVAAALRGPAAALRGANAPMNDAGYHETGHAAEQLLNQRFSNTDARRRKMRILSMDGGGARGLYTTCILARIAQEEPRLLDNIDLIAGTST